MPTSCPTRIPIAGRSGQAITPANRRARSSVMPSNGRRLGAAPPRRRARAGQLGGALVERLAHALADVRHVGEVRGLGLFVGIEIVSDPSTGAADPARATAVRRRAFENGVLLGGGGHEENVIKICPPLTIDAALLDTAVDLTIDAIKRTR